MQRAVERQPAGTTFCVAAGHYRIGASGLKLQNGDVIDGVGRPHPGRRQGAMPAVSIRGRGTVVLYGGDGVVVQDVSITDRRAPSSCSSAESCGAAVDPGDRWRLRHVRIHHADAQCVGSPGRGLVIVDAGMGHCGNRFDGPDNNGFAAAIKGGSGGAFVIKRSYIHDSNQGIWCDVDCASNNGGRGFVAVGNLVLNNCSTGIHYEHTYLKPWTPAKAYIARNIAKGNNWCRQAGAKADIAVVSAEHARVVANRMGHTSAHPTINYGFAAANAGDRGRPTGSASNNSLNGDQVMRSGSFKSRGFRA